MVQSLFKMLVVGSSSTSDGHFELRKNFFTNTRYELNEGQGVEQILKGLIHQEAQTRDRFIDDDLTKALFEINTGFASDLGARNIQRGRDHGLPSYNDFRAHCNLPKACNWDSKPDELTSDTWDVLKNLYVDPDDLDLFVAGLAEIPSTSGGVLGETFKCLVSDQFMRLKFGDRFFFTHQAGTNPSTFSPDQMVLLMQRNLGEIMCDNTDLEFVKENVFLQDSTEVPCSEAFKLNLEFFV